jgi:protein arginine kinase
MLPDKFRGLADKMFIEIQPGHVQFSAGKSIEPSSRDELRADVLRNQFARIPSLNLHS